MHPLVWVGAGLVGLFIYQKSKGGAQSFPVVAQTPAMVRPLGSVGPGQQNDSGYNPSGFWDGLSEAPQASQPLNPNMNVNAPHVNPVSPVPFETLPWATEVVLDPGKRIGLEIPAAGSSAAPGVVAQSPKVRGSIISTERTAAIPV